MTTLLLVTLVLLDVALLGAVFVQRRRGRDARLELVEELTEERRLLQELRTSVHEELAAAQGKARETLSVATRLAAEAEHEVKHGGSAIAQEMEAVAAQMAARLEEPMKELSRKQAAVESLLRKIEAEKSTVARLLARGEKLVKFFDERVPYEEVLEEIKDKKYADARALLARGKTPSTVASELGLNESEVRLIAGLG
jgi:hypothetical protein